MIKAEVINQLSEEAILKRLNGKINNASAVLINEIERVSLQFTPRRNDGLIDSLKKEKEGDRFVGISYNTPYARRMWYGDETWNWNLSKSPKAGPRWIKRAFEVYNSEIFKSVVEELEK